MSWLEDLWTDIETTVTKDAVYVEQAVSTLFANEKAALAPILETALTGFAAAIATNPTPSNIASAAGAAWSSLAPQLESAAIGTGISTLVTAVNSGLVAAVTQATAAPSPAPTV